VFTNSSATDLSATYNGVAMTRLSFFADASGSNKNAVFYLVNPSSGTNTVSVTRTGGANMSIVASAYSGVDTSSPIDDSVTDAGTSSTSFTSSAVTVSDADNWLIGAFRDTDGRVASSTQLTQRVASSTVSEEIWDSNGAIGSTGSQTVTYTITPSGRLDGHTLISLAVGSAPTTSIKSINGVAIASVGKVNGVAIADVKNYNGVSNVS